jgi:transcriptional regulator with XRE-family HTH domain
MNPGYHVAFGQTTPYDLQTMAVVEDAGASPAGGFDLDIRDVVDRARVAVGGSQAELARRLGVAGSAVSTWYSGKGLPSYESCLRLARITGVPARSVLVAAHHDPTLLPDAPEEATLEEQEILDRLQVREWQRKLQTIPDPQRELLGEAVDALLDRFAEVAVPPGEPPAGPRAPKDGRRRRGGR